MIHPTDWMAKAKCRDWPNTLFFYEEGSRFEPWRQRRALAVCEGCPVRRDCLRYALTLERAGSISLGHAHFANAIRDALGNLVGWSWSWKAFTASTTPATGIWGGFTPPQRHARAIKHKAGCQEKKCSGCRPLDEWVDSLLEGSAA